jgi:phenylalanyl-tRNA synthetase beta subunit
VYGYEKIETKKLPKIEKESKINKDFYYTEKIRDLLAKEGFSEVYTYTLVNNGEVEIANPLASDKSFLRGNLRDGLAKSLELNSKNTPLLGLEDVKIFEIGIVFKGGDEHLSLGIAASDPSNKLGNTVKTLEDTLGIKLDHLAVRPPSDGVFEVDLNKIIEKLPQPDSYDISYDLEKDVKYSPISQYPFVLRDIAVWVPKEIEKEEVIDTIKKESGDLLVRNDIFDQFEKDERISYAFHLVFQSYEKTLSDAEINEIMDGVTETINGRRGWEVR